MNILRKRSQRLPHGAIVLIALFVAGSCSEGDKVEPNLRLLDKEDYFPLHSGDHWELAFEPRRSIELIRTLNDLDYYGMVSDDDTVYYRKTTDGKVYERRSTTKEFLRFDLSADVGQTWTFKTSGFDESWNATLVSKVDTVKIGDHKILNCYRF